MSQQRKLAVTGATGFVGAHLVTRAFTRGDAVRALVRASSDTSHLESLGGVEIVRVDLSDPASVDAALRGVNAVVHLAGGGKVRSTSDFYAANTDSARAVVEASIRAGVDRFLLVSSLAAHGPSEDGTPAVEHDPPRPVSHYGRSKLAAEEVVLAAKDRLPVTILRPPAVYGPGDTRMLSLFRWAARGAVPQLGAEGTLSLVHVEDCVRAILTILERERESGGIYFVDDGRVYTRAELMESVGAAVGKRPRVVAIPVPLLVGVGCGVEAVMRTLGRPYVLGRDKVADLRQRHWVCSSGRLQERLDFAPTVPLEQGMQSTARWYRQEGWL